jgi:hypothetical protein
VTTSPARHRAAGPGLLARGRRLLGSWSWLPLPVVALFVVLVALGTHGSSVGSLAGPGPDPSLLAGDPRDIRSDEYLIATPLAVSAARQGFPESMQVGLTRTSQPALAHGAPVWGWTSLLKPQDWGYLLLAPVGVEHGVAWRWWTPYLVSVLGLAALLRRLGVRAALAAPLAVAGTLTPYQAWWSAPAPGLVLGYGAAVGACLIAALDARRERSAAAWGVAAGALGGAFALVLYPAWQVSVVLVVAGCVVGAALDRRTGLRRVLVTGGTTLAVSGSVVALWYRDNREAIAATLGTVYPGRAAAEPDQAQLAWLLSAPLNPVLSGPAGATVSDARSGVMWTNLSELSASWLPLPVLAAAVVLCLLAGRRAARRWTVLGISAAVVLLLAWAVLPLPDWTGTLLLERVKGTRVPLALGLGAVLLIALAASARTRLTGRVRASRQVRVAGWVAVAGLTAAQTGWAATRMPWDPATVSVPVLVVLAVGTSVVLTWVVLGPARRAAAAAFAVLALVSFAAVNPLYRGLGPLEDSPVVDLVRPAAAADPGVRVVVLGPLTSVALVRATGAQVVSGTTFYPDHDLASRLLPLQEEVWNSYLNLTWEPVPQGEPAHLQRVRGTSVRLLVDPCADVVRERLRPELLLATVPLEHDCLQPVDRTSADGQTWTLYRYRTPGGPG